METESTTVSRLIAKMEITSVVVVVNRATIKVEGAQMVSRLLFRHAVTAEEVNSAYFESKLALAFLAPI